MTNVLKMGTSPRFSTVQTTLTAPPEVVSGGSADTESSMLAETRSTATSLESVQALPLESIPSALSLKVVFVSAKKSRVATLKSPGSSRPIFSRVPRLFSERVTSLRGSSPELVTRHVKLNTCSGQASTSMGLTLRLIPGEITLISKAAESDTVSPPAVMPSARPETTRLSSAK